MNSVQRLMGIVAISLLFCTYNLPIALSHSTLNTTVPPYSTDNSSTRNHSKASSNDENRLRDLKSKETAFLDTTAEIAADEQEQNSSEFTERSRKSFLALDPKPRIQSMLMPEEKRRQIWLSRHNHRARAESSAKGEGNL